MRVTLRNKKNIGLICFMLVSSSDFGLLCCTITHYNYKGKMAKISPKIHKIKIWLPQLLFHEFITFGRDFGRISILSIFGLILAIFPM